MNVPCQGWVHMSVAHMLVPMAKDTRVNAKFIFTCYKPYVYSLNKAAKTVVDEGYDFLLNIDDDNAPERNPFDLCFFDKDVIGLPTPIWIDHGVGTPCYFNTVKYHPEKDGFTRVGPPKLDQDALMKVDAVGSGAILVHRRVLEKVKAPFMREWDEDGIPTRGCDFAFCMRVREAGFDVWAHYDYTCTHYKELNLAKAAEGMMRAVNIDKYKEVFGEPKPVDDAEFIEDPEPVEVG